jgi:hypothetical protein
MPSLIFNYGEWTYWEDYNPPNYVGNQKVTFDGPNKLILVNEEVLLLDVQNDIYSNWKEWSLQRDNLKFLRALTPVGGDPITNEISIGDSYFLENGWRIQPYQAYNGYLLEVVGNIYTREPNGNPVNPTPKVSVLLTRANISETIDTTPANQIDLIGDEVVSRFADPSMTPTTISTKVNADFAVSDSGNKLLEIWQILGLDSGNMKTITDAEITVNGITLSISNPNSDTTTVTRQ